MPAKTPFCEPKPFEGHPDISNGGSKDAWGCVYIYIYTIYIYIYVYIYIYIHIHAGFARTKPGTQAACQASEQNMGCLSTISRRMSGAFSVIPQGGVVNELMMNFPFWVLL